eukprot:6132741-Alexandrium_andersonii.AAC.1
MSASLVGSEMCIRDRPISAAEMVLCVTPPQRVLGFPPTAALPLDPWVATAWHARRADAPVPRPP